MKDWKPLDWIICIITASICMTILLGISRAILTGDPLSQPRLELLVGIISSLVSIVSMYVGATIQRRADRDRDEKKPPE